MPNGEHDNILEFSGVSELISFMKGDLVLRYKWLPKTPSESRSEAWAEVVGGQGKSSCRPGGVGEG